MRQSRNCDREEPGVSLAFPFAPELNRCPWSQITPRVRELLAWWVEWKRFSTLPYGGRTIDDEPHYVYEVLTVCDSQQLSSEEMGDGRREPRGWDQVKPAGR